MSELKLYCAEAGAWFVAESMDEATGMLRTWLDECGYSGDELEDMIAEGITEKPGDKEITFRDEDGKPVGDRKTAAEWAKESGKGLMFEFEP